ncbi:MAG: hypothetical protein U1A78_05010 [Polyangia bacterium]
MRRRNVLSGLVGGAAGLVVPWAVTGSRAAGAAAEAKGTPSAPSSTSSTSSTTPAFDVVWAQPTSGMRPVRSGSLVLAVAADQRAVLALDEVSGRVLWRSAAPRGVTWTAVVTRPAGAAVRARLPEPLVLATGYDEHGSVLARLGAGGAVRWLRRSPAIEDFDEVTAAEHGEALKLFSRRRCAAWFLDSESGERRGPPGQKLSLSGEMIERWPVHGMGGEPHLSCQNSLTLLAALDGVVVVSSFGKRAGLQVLAAGSEPRWKLPGQGFRLLHAGDGALVLYWFAAGERAVLARLRAQTGQALWREELGAACADDVIARWPLVVRGAAGEPTAVLVQDCERASLYELPSGKRRWSRPTGGGLVLLTADTTATAGIAAEGEELPLFSRRAAELAVRWFTPAGEPAGAATLPSTTRALTPVPGGLVAHNQALDRVAMIRSDGRTAWSHDEPFGNSFRIGDRYVVLPSNSPTVQVTIDLATGKTVRLPLDSPFVLGRASADPSLWLTTRRSSVVGLRLR